MKLQNTDGGGRGGGGGLEKKACGLEKKGDHPLPQPCTKDFRDMEGDTQRQDMNGHMGARPMGS